ncbi:hypothetical protein F4604DRAFT_1190435 [Suillus subluteus]|nr:hypothetical protein F4604DRAFT_1190435 [Suillus subluteus]
MSEYVQPYFESKARALRAVWSVKSGRFESPAATGNRLNARSRDKISTIQTPLQPKKKWRKAKVEWKGQRIVINHGTLSLQGFIRSSFELYTVSYRIACSPPSYQGGTPLHYFQLTSLHALRGAESLARACSIIAKQRVVCSKFQGKEFMASCVSTSSLPMSLPSSPIAEDWKIDVQIEATDHGTQFNSHRLSITHTAFSNILRILHRHTSHPISSSSLPTSSIITVADYWNNLSSPALTPFVYSSPYDSLPYPEWRTKTVQTMCKCLGGLRTRQLAP